MTALTLVIFYFLNHKSKGRDSWFIWSFLLCMHAPDLSDVIRQYCVPCVSHTGTVVILNNSDHFFITWYQTKGSTDPITLGGWRPFVRSMNVTPYQLTLPEPLLAVNIGHDSSSRTGGNIFNTYGLCSYVVYLLQIQNIFSKYL